MKNKKILLTFLFCASTSSFADVVTQSNYSKELDEIRKETDIWVSKGTLESTKKVALADMLESANLEDMLRSRERELNEKSGLSQNSVVTESDFYKYAMTADAYSSMEGQSESQGEILDANGTPVAEENGDDPLSNLKKEQQEFFNQVKEYISVFSKKPDYERSIDDIDSDSKASVVKQSFAFDNFSAKIASRTKRTIEIAFAIGVKGKDPAFLMQKITPETKEFDLHFFGMETIRVIVDKIENDYIVLDVNGAKIVAN